MTVSAWRLRSWVACLGLATLALVLRLAMVQLVQHQRFLEEAEKQQEALVPLESPRGTITTRDGLVLAGTVEKVAVYANPKKIPRHQWAQVAAQLSPLVGQAPAAILAAFSQREGFFYLAKGLDPAIAKEVAKLGGKGVGTLPFPQRVYPLGTLAGPVVGFVNAEGKGQAGVEAFCQNLLAGEPALVRLARDGKRVPTNLAVQVEKPGRPGYHLVLTLSGPVQWILEEELARTLEEVGGRGAAAVAMDPQSGEVWGLASVPSFAPQDLNSYSRERWHHRAVETVLEPGSTFKPFVVAAALQAGVVNPQSLVDCSGGGVEVAGFFFRDHARYGILPLRQLLSFSSNAGAIRLALRTPAQVLDQVIRALGFGQKTGIELPAESPGLYRPLPTGTWSALTPAGLALGQEISVTAIQLARAYAALANGGLLVQPTLIAEVRDREGNQVAVNGKNTFKHALPQEVAKAVATLLQGVVEEGTGKAAAVAGYPVAGKTGTAQKAVGGSYRAGQHAAWFAGFLPMPNPRLVLVVCVDEPRQTFWASEVAAPAFGRMAQRLVHVLQVPPSWGGQA